MTERLKSFSLTFAGKYFITDFLCDIREAI